MARNFKQGMLGALVLVSLASSSAFAQTPYNIVWDSFSGGFTQGDAVSKWYHPRMGTFITNDANTQVLSNGLYVGSRGVNASTGLPAFSITVGREETNGGLPGMLDHAKWLAYMNHVATSGYQGHDAVPGQELACSARIIGQTFGTRFHPFGSKVQNENVDPRLAGFALATIDWETNLAFDFLFTNRRIYAVYERSALGRTDTNRYAAFIYAIPVGNRSKDAAHSVSIAYNRSAGTVRWILDGQEVYRVSQIGYRLSSRKNMLLDHGGTDQIVTMRQLNCGMGMFTILDGASGSQSGLVRLSSALNYYYQPAKGEPNALSFVDEYSQPSSRLFGQGAEFRIGAYSVSSTSTSVSSPPPVYSEPDPINQLPGDGADGAPDYGSIPY
jgi:hypothetical protein